MARPRLAEYRRKRDFRSTAEPAGGKTRPSRRPRFVVQKHDARSLHYDFRLEVDRVLKSWAVPKGPSADPKVRRLAVPTEDHPLEYAGFEGIIPEHEYGGGTVMIWDRGTYQNLREAKPGDGATMAQSLKQGMVEVRLHGKKLKGGYVLVRTGFGLRNPGWLLKKIADGPAPAREPIEALPNSAKTGRTMAQIASAKA